MLQSRDQTIYTAFGFSITSEIPLPELPQSTRQADDIDIHISLRDLTALWVELSDSRSYFVVTKHMIMFKIPDVAIFCVEDGENIFVSPFRDADVDVIRLYLLGTCMGALLIQNNIIPLHGSAIAIDGKAYAIIGESGAGKSTLATALLSKGFQLLTDDVIAVTVSETNVPYVIPSYPQQKLWLETLNYFGMGRDEYRPVFQRETKFSIPVSAQFTDQPLPLAGVFELVKKEKGDIEMQKVEKLQCLQTLYLHTYRNFLVKRLNVMEWHFNQCIQIANCVKTYRLLRSDSIFSVSRLANLALSTINEGADVYA